MVSAVICTRNRGNSILSAVESLLANTYPNFELVVIDQSSDNHTAQALAPFAGDTRLRYIRTNTQGVGLARAMGLNAARAELVAMTDDDCDVPTDWLEHMVNVLEQHPRAAIVFCDVVAAPHDPEKGWILTNVSSENREIDSLKAWNAAGGANAGIGAGMAVRRTAIQRIGNVDAHLGAGGYFRSGWETDITLRALLNKHAVYRTNSTSVIHFGFRTHEQGRSLMRRYMFGIAAVYAKLLKCGYWQLLPVIFSEAWRTVIAPGATALLRLRKPPVLGRAVSLVQGLSQGWRARIDRSREVFQIRTTS